VKLKQLQTEHTEKEGSNVTLEGWVRNHRPQKTFGFLDLNDGTCFETVQVVYDQTLDNFDETRKIRNGSAVRIEGEVVLTPKRPQPFEIKAHEVEVVGAADADYPIQPKRHSREFLRQKAHLRPRTNLFTAVFRIRSLLTQAIHDFFQSRGFIHLASPIITANDAEGAGEMFRVTTLDPKAPPLDDSGAVDFSQDFFGRKTNLTVSGQLHAEAFAQAFRDVYTFGPTFRAEKSHTSTHVSEFWMVEPEMAFTDLQGNMDVCEDMVRHLIRQVLKHADSELEFLDRFVENGLLRRLERVASSEFVRITHTEAVDILEQSRQTFERPFEKDFASEHEKYLLSYFDAPVFVTDWPKDTKAFYMRLNDDNETVAAVDLLAPGGGEIVGGSQREERYTMLKKRMDEMGIDTEELDWYLQLRRFGTTPHSGFGLGFERMLMYVTGVSNIRDVIPFPRTPNNCEY